MSVRRSKDSLASQRIQIGQRQKARLHLPFDLGDLILAQTRLEGIAGHDRQPGITSRGLLPGLHDDAGEVELDEGALGFRAFNRHVDDQPGRLPIVEQVVDLFS